MQFHCQAEGWRPALRGKAQDIWFSFTLSLIYPNNGENVNSNLNMPMKLCKMLKHM